MPNKFYTYTDRQQMELTRLLAHVEGGKINNLTRVILDWFLDGKLKYNEKPILRQDRQGVGHNIKSKAE